VIQWRGNRPGGAIQHYGRDEDLTGWIGGGFRIFPYASVSGGSADVTCTLTVTSTATQTRTLTNVPAGTVAAIPLSVAGTVGASGGTASVACSESGTASVSVTTSLNAVQTQSNS
jgi:hypothetical protein